MKYICKWCKNSFEAKSSSNRIYCSNLCYSLSSKIHKFVICKNCHKEFELPRAHKPQDYCSISCKGEAKRKTKKIECRNCGKAFEINWQGSKRIYCSLECNNKAKDTRIEVNCATCGKSYLARPRDLENGLDKYCSVECRGKAKRDKRIVVCKTCGKEFETVKSELTRRGGVKYCSRKCHFQSTDYKAHGNANGGKRTDLNNQYFRSSWEANYSRLLNYLKERYIIKSWEYEPQQFDIGGNTYCPDFRVESINGSIGYHEVKGYKSALGTQKINKFQELYPELPLTLIDEKVYINLAHTYSRSIPGWEIDRYAC